MHIPKKDGGRGLIEIEDYTELAVRGLKAYVHGEEERLIQAAMGDKLDGLEAICILKRGKRIDCKIGRRKLYMTSI